MKNLPTPAAVSMYVLIVVTALVFVLLWVIQLRVMRGGRFENPDGSADDWHEQKIIFGMALADVLVSAPTAIVGAVLALLASRWGFYLLAFASFFGVWANVMTTATSLKFENPKITFTWFVAFPFGAVLGLAYLVMSFVYFDDLYAP